MLFIFAFWQKRIFKKLLLFMTVIPHITNIFLERLYQEFDGTKENPFLFQKKYRDTRVRYVKGFPFGIYYVVDEKSITILAVLHTSRNPETWKSR